MEDGSAPMRVTIAAADEALARRMSEVLAGVGASVKIASTIEAAARNAFSERPDAILFDLRIDEAPDQVLRFLRAATDVPIIAIGAELAPELAVAALEAGADDMISSTIGSSELMARLRARIRGVERVRAAVDQPQLAVVRTGELVIDRETRRVTKSGDAVRLTRTEYRLLDELASRAGEIAPWRYLVSVMWDEVSSARRNYLRLYINYLRRKLETSSSEPRYIRTVWGVGYQLALLPLVDRGVAGHGGETDARSTDELTRSPH